MHISKIEGLTYNAMESQAESSRQRQLVDQIISDVSLLLPDLSRLEGGCIAFEGANDFIPFVFYPAHQLVALNSKNKPEYQDEYNSHFSRLNYDVTSGPLDCFGVSDDFLWNHLKHSEKYAGEVLRHLQHILAPILKNEPNIEELEFILYRPGKVSTDNQEGFREHDESFTLDVTDGSIDFTELMRRFNHMSPDQAIGISSRVKVKGQIIHRPQIDFKTPVNLDDIQASLGNLHFPESTISDSGNSYHYRGHHLDLPDYQHTKYLDFIKDDPNIGENWPSYSSHQNFSFLRITPNIHKPFWPEPIRPNGISELIDYVNELEATL